MLNWNEIDTVLLDMDGTLLDLHFDNHFWHEHLPLHWSRNNKINLEQAKQELIPWIKSHEGTLNWYCLDFWSRELGVNIMEIKYEIKDKIKVRRDTIEFLKFLQEQKKEIVMVTNAHQDLIQMKFEHTDIGDYFHHVYCSHEFGVPKEEVMFWEKLSEQYQFVRERSVLFDDNLRVLESAKQYGIAHLISIIQPDSNKPPREITDYSAIDHFSEVMTVS